MLWTINCGGSKTINLLSKNSTFSLECFLEDYKDCNKKFNAWTKAAETLQSEIAQVTEHSLACNVRKIQACVRIMKDIYIGTFSTCNSQKSLSLLHAQVNGKCPDSSSSPLKRNCSTKWIKNCDVVSVFTEFHPAVAGSLDQLSESRNEEVLERAMPYLKAITTAEFLVSLEVVNATQKLTKTVAKKPQGIKELY